MIIRVHVVTASNQVDVHRCAYESVEEMYAKEEEFDGNTVLEYWTDEST
jgi:hypothetical protein